MRSEAVSVLHGRDVVWPELPAAPLERNLPLACLNDLRTKSAASRQRLGLEHGEHDPKTSWVVG